MVLQIYQLTNYQLTNSPRLALSAEGASIRSRVQRLAAVPAESRLGRLARFDAHLDFLQHGGGVGLHGRGLRRARRSAAAGGARRDDVVEDLAGALVAAR